ncbi:MAG: hypothetical protein KA774_05535 [Burkholderiaceae bacterium]|nr:hypothetical protein [Burkholderiaceae bacterium]
MASSAQLQQLLGKSQPTLSRLLSRLARQQLALGQPPLVVLGRQRSARYALAQPLLGLPGQQPLFWTDESGQRQAWGQLTHLGGERLHLQADGIDLLAAGRLPWLLAPMRLQGFLGRLWARSVLAAGYDANLERWRIAQLLALLLRQVHDLPGAVALGDLTAPAQPQAPADPAALPAFLDAQALAVAKHPAGGLVGRR